MSRSQQMDAFLSRHGWDGAARSVLAEDASFRRYERVQDGWRRAVLMDAPPDREALGPFCRVADILLKLDLSAPEILARDDAQGFLLLEDLGDDTFTRMLAAGADEATLYAQAMETLVHLHRRFTPGLAGPDFPVYDDDRLLAEVALFTDWYLPAIDGAAPGEAARTGFLDIWRDLLPQARGVPDTLVLRDYHVDNLIWLPERPSPNCVGLLDFQDAVLGPVTYDIVSLLRDARRDVGPDVVTRMEGRYLAAFSDLDHDRFRTSCAVLSAQRNMKIIGIFTRLDRRDGKPRYLHHIDRVWRLLHDDMRHPALAPMAAWLDQTLPRDRRITPDPA